MGAMDAKAKRYMQRPAVFADAFNYLLYDGRQVLQPENLKELDPTEIVLPKGSGSKLFPLQRYRDVLKKAVVMSDQKAAYLMLLGIENQTKIHYAMPVRNMIYDALNYGRQVSVLEQKNRQENEKNTASEFLSGFRKADKLMPVITLVVSFSQEAWDGPKSIHEMFDACDPEVLKYVPDYFINLIEPVTMSDEQIAKFHTDFGQLATIIQCGRDKQMMQTKVMNDERFKHMDPLTADLACSATSIKIKQGSRSKGEVNMCQAVIDIHRDGVLKGTKNLASMLNWLYAIGRGEEVPKVVGNEKYMNRMLKEYQKEINKQSKTENEQ